MAAAFGAGHGAQHRCVDKLDQSPRPRHRQDNLQPVGRAVLEVQAVRLDDRLPPGVALPDPIPAPGDAGP